MSLESKKDALFESLNYLPCAFMSFCRSFVGDENKVRIQVQRVFQKRVAPYSLVTNKQHSFSFVFSC